MHNQLCEFLHPGNRVTSPPAVPAMDDITHLNVLTFDPTPLPAYPETSDLVNKRYRTVVNELSDRHWPTNVLFVSHEICVREALKWGGCEDDVEATYCGHVELERREKDSYDWSLCSYEGVFKFEPVI